MGIEGIGFDMIGVVHPRGVHAALAVEHFVTQPVGGEALGVGPGKAHGKLAQAGERGGERSGSGERSGFDHGAFVSELST